jgi:hypothetical protein
VSEPLPSVAELLAQAKLNGVVPDEADLAGVRDFLTVFLPALDELARHLPADASGPGPVGSE